MFCFASLLTLSLQPVYVLAETIATKLGLEHPDEYSLKLQTDENVPGAPRVVVLFRR